MDDSELQQLEEYLKSDKLFGVLPDEFFRQVLTRFERVLIPKSEAVFRQGDQNVDFYFLVSGECEVWMESGRSMRCEHVAGAGNGFGSAAAVNDKPSSVSIIARTNCRLCKLPRELFKKCYKEARNVAESRARQSPNPRQRLQQQLYNDNGRTSPTPRAQSPVPLRDFDSTQEKAQKERKNQRRRSWALLKHYVAKEKEVIEQKQDAATTAAPNRRQTSAFSQFSKGRAANSSNAHFTEENNGTVNISILRAATSEERRIQFGTSATAAEIKEVIRAEFSLMTHCVLRLVDSNGERVMISKRLPSGSYTLYEGSENDATSTDRVIYVTYEDKHKQIQISPNDTPAEVKDLLRNEFNLPSQMMIRLINAQGRSIVISPKVSPGHYRLMTSLAHMSDEEDGECHMSTEHEYDHTPGRDDVNIHVITIVHGQLRRQVQFHSADSPDEIKDAILNEFGLVAKGTPFRLTNDAQRGVVINSKLRRGTYQLHTEDYSNNNKDNSNNNKDSNNSNSNSNNTATTVEISHENSHQKHQLDIHNIDTPEQIRELIKHMFGIESHLEIGLVNCHGRGVVISSQLQAGQYTLMFPIEATVAATNAYSIAKEAADDAENAAMEAVKISEICNEWLSNVKDAAQQQQSSKNAADAAVWAQIAEENAGKAVHAQMEIGRDFEITQEAARAAVIAARDAAALLTRLKQQPSTMNEAIVQQIEDSLKQVQAAVNKANDATEVASRALDIANESVSLCESIKSSTTLHMEHQAQAQADNVAAKDAAITQAIEAMESAQKACMEAHEAANEAVLLESAIRLVTSSDNRLLDQASSHVQACVTAAKNCSQAAEAAKEACNKCMTSDNSMTVFLASTIAKAAAASAVTASGEAQGGLRAVVHIGGILRDRSIQAAAHKAMDSRKLAKSAVILAETSVRRVEYALKLTETSNNEEAIAKVSGCLSSATRAHQEALAASNMCEELRSDLEEAVDPDAAMKLATKCEEAAKIAETMGSATQSIATAALQAVGLAQEEAAHVAASQALAISKLQSEAEAACERAQKAESEAKLCLMRAMDCGDAIRWMPHVESNLVDQIHSGVAAANRESSRAETASRSTIRAATKASSASQLSIVEAATLSAISSASEAESAAKLCAVSVTDVISAFAAARELETAAENADQRMKSGGIAAAVAGADKWCGKTREILQDSQRLTQKATQYSIELAAASSKLTTLAIEAATTTMEVTQNIAKAYQATQQAVQSARCSQDPTVAQLAASVGNAAYIGAQAALHEAEAIISRLQEAIENQHREETPPLPAITPRPTTIPTTVAIQPETLTTTSESRREFVDDVMNLKQKAKEEEDKANRCFCEMRDLMKDLTALGKQFNGCKSVDICSEAMTIQAAGKATLESATSSMRMCMDAMNSFNDDIYRSSLEAASAFAIVKISASQIQQGHSTIKEYIENMKRIRQQNDGSEIMSPQQELMAQVQTLVQQTRDRLVAEMQDMMMAKSTSSSTNPNLTQHYSNDESTKDFERRLALMGDRIDTSECEMSRSLETVLSLMHCMRLEQEKMGKRDDVLEGKWKAAMGALVYDAVDSAIMTRFEIDVQQEAKALALSILDIDNLRSQVIFARDAAEKAREAAEEAAKYAYDLGPCGEMHLPKNEAARNARLGLLKLVEANEELSSSLTAQSIAKNRSHGNILETLRGMINDERKMRLNATTEILSSQESLSSSLSNVSATNIAPLASLSSSFMHKSASMVNSSHQCLGTSGSWNHHMHHLQQQQQEETKRRMYESEASRIMSSERQQLEIELMAPNARSLRSSTSALSTSSSSAIPTRTESSNKFGPVGLGRRVGLLGPSSSYLRTKLQPSNPGTCLPQSSIALFGSSSLDVQLDSSGLRTP